MAKKPWHEFERGKQLEAFIGAQGVKTSTFATSNEIITCAEMVFAYDDEKVFLLSVDEAAAWVESLGRKGRKDRAAKNFGRFSHLTNADAPKTTGSAEVTQNGLEKMFADDAPQLVSGKQQDLERDLDINPANLLRKVISAVISHGQGHILYDFPEVMQFLKSRIPDRDELSGHHSINEDIQKAKENWE